mmetsp:Transcript_3342/g.6331  ORF Transcript_3342/g.6331 Transcript_3342/m.6331 type:complete len:208 (-) Transcript_3342:5641-6264(-)
MHRRLGAAHSWHLFRCAGRKPIYLGIFPHARHRLWNHPRLTNPLPTRTLSIAGNFNSLQRVPERLTLGCSVCTAIVFCFAFFLCFRTFSHFFLLQMVHVCTLKSICCQRSHRPPAVLSIVSSFFLCVVEKKKAHSFKPHDSGQDRPSHRISQFATAFTSLALVVGWIFSHAIHRTAESPLFILHIVFYLFYAAGLLSCPGCCLTLCG